MGLTNKQFLLSASKTALQAVLGYDIPSCIMVRFIDCFKAAILGIIGTLSPLFKKI